MDRPRLDANDGLAPVDVNAALIEDAVELPPNAAIVIGKDLVGGGEKVERQPVRAGAPIFQEPVEAVMGAEEKLHAARSGAHDGDPVRSGTLAGPVRSGGHLVDRLLPSSQELVHRLDPERVLPGSRHPLSPWRGTHIDRE